MLRAAERLCMISWSSSALARSGMTADDVLALTGEPLEHEDLYDLDDESDAAPYRAGAEPEVQLISLNGAPTIVYTSVEVDRYTKMNRQVLGRGSRD
jgi:hypothetical protein